VGDSAATTKPLDLVSTEHITRAMLVLRGHKVLLDTELAALYGVTTKRFNEKVRRNRERFPEGFMFQLTAAELAPLRSQIATLKGAADSPANTCPTPSPSTAPLWPPRS
jgi:hypothetical protein